MKKKRTLRRFLIVFPCFSSKDLTFDFSVSVEFCPVIVVRLDDVVLGALLSRIIDIRGFSFEFVVEGSFDDRLIIDFLELLSNGCV